MVTILTSFTVNRSHSGRTAPCWTRNLICAALPPLVALLTAHAASFRMSNSALLNSWTNGGTMLLSTTAWIWSLFPAVMLEMVQHASFRMPFLGLDRRARRQGRALLLMTNCVWRSSPVTMFPTVRRAGVWTAGLGLRRSSTRRRQTPASMTAWIFSLGPDALEVRLGLAPAEVGQGPRGVPEHGELGPLVELGQEGGHGPRGQDEVPAGGGVARDVPQGPHGLLADVVVGAEEEPDEDG